MLNGMRLAGQRQKYYSEQLRATAEPTVLSFFSHWLPDPQFPQMKRGQVSPAPNRVFCLLCFVFLQEEPWTWGAQVFIGIVIMLALGSRNFIFQGFSLHKHPWEDNLEQRQRILLLPKCAKTTTETRGELSFNTYFVESYRLKLFTIIYLFVYL